MDSGASHHITDNPSNLTSVTYFSGTDEIIIGDGNSIPISHIGQTTFYSTSTARSFSLHHVLCSPKIRCNLISVAQFCRQNLTSIEFFPYSYVVKDLNTGAALLQGWSNNDLYEWPTTKLPSRSTSLSHQTHFSASQSPTLHLWHARLGHPQPCITKSFISSFKHPVSLSNSFTFCNSCLCNKSHQLPFGAISIVSHRPFEII